MNRLPLRWMFLIPILTTIVVGFTLFAVFADRVERESRITDIDAELVRAAQGGADAGQPQELDGRPSPPLPDQLPQASSIDVSIDNPIELVIDANGVVISTGPSGNPFSPSTVADLMLIDGFSSVQENSYRVLVTSAGSQTSVTGLSLATFDEATADFRRALALGGGIIVALATFVIWMLTRSLTRPITQIASVANRIADGELDIELDATSPSREIDELGNDLQRMLQRLTATLSDTERAAAEATQARDDMQRFLADVAHELRTPLTALKGYSDLYEGGMLATTTDVDRAMSRIGSESDRLSKLVTDMLQLARQGTASEATEVVDVAVVAATVAGDLRAANPGQTITFSASPGNHDITGVSAQIHQATLNLGANACAHSDPKDVVAVHIDSTSAAVVLRVVDHGPGVHPLDRERIFLPFFRTDASRSRDGESGAGLGLALTKQIAERHNGTIDVKSTPGGGATFVLTLPRNNS